MSDPESSPGDREGLRQEGTPLNPPTRGALRCLAQALNATLLILARLPESGKLQNMRLHDLALAQLEQARFYINAMGDE